MSSIKPSSKFFILVIVFQFQGFHLILLKMLFIEIYLFKSLSSYFPLTLYMASINFLFSKSNTWVH